MPTNSPELREDILEGGLRLDYQNKYGAFILPRLNGMYKFSQQFYIRAGAGLGYKTPTFFQRLLSRRALTKYCHFRRA
ncbi:MAG: TonB-dependent receptor [Chitinophagaceae bacterium]|nr:MAG: TonB-dependent receptor [Chitinophagaceae bacterium]